MNFKFQYLFLGALIIFSSCGQKAEQQTQDINDEQITFNQDTSQNRIDVLIGNRLFTSYRWPDNVYKPVLYPIISSGGTTITRGFPLETREGERNDHRHQVGNWLNYGNVNGYDFWGNGHTGEKLPNGGEIRHIGVEETSAGKGEASMTTTSAWLDPSGKELLSEETRFHFISRGEIRMIDRTTTLTASGGEPVTFKDTKEGMFGLRVARQLEMPSKEELTLTDASGQPTTVKKMSNEGVTGNYRSSEGITGEQVWSTRAKWMNLHGSIGDENISIVICDHPKNVSYPTWWHARGYGLFSANPLGAKDFTQGKEELNFAVPAGESVTFRYRIIVASGKDLTDDDINKLADEFAKKY